MTTLVVSRQQGRLGLLLHLLLLLLMQEGSASTPKRKSTEEQEMEISSSSQKRSTSPKSSLLMASASSFAAKAAHAARGALSAAAAAAAAPTPRGPYDDDATGSLGTSPTAINRRQRLDVAVIYDDDYDPDDDDDDNQVRVAGDHETAEDKKAGELSTAGRSRRRRRRFPLSSSTTSTSLLIAAPPQPSLSHPTYADTGRRNGSLSLPPASTSSSSAMSSSAEATRTQRDRYRSYNCPMMLAQFVEERQHAHQRQRQQKQKRQNVLYLQLDVDDPDPSSRPVIPDDRTLTLLQRQLVILHSGPEAEEPAAPAPANPQASSSEASSAPSSHRRRRRHPRPPPTNLPSYELVLRTCYVLSAWMSLVSAEGAASASAASSAVATVVAVLYGCRRRDGPEKDSGDADAHVRGGKSACALVAACWLKYSSQVESVQQGLDMVLSAMMVGEPSGPASADDGSRPPSYWGSVPPSVRRFLTQFDQWVDRNGCGTNTGPLLLRAISIQGLPVDKMPVVEVYGHRHRDGASRTTELLYSSSLATTASHEAGVPPGGGGACQWAEEEGFFELGSDVVLEGEWSVVVRFAQDDELEEDEEEEVDPGAVADDDASSRIILRYVGHAGFMRPGIHDLDATQVDVVRPYEGAILYEGSDFLLSIVVDAHWSLPPDAGASFPQGATDAVLPAYHPHGARAQECGWQLIAKHHAARPTPDDVRHFRVVSGMDGTRRPAPPDHMVSLALQLSNYDVPSAQDWLLHRFYSWWGENAASPVANVAPPTVHGLPIVSPPMSAEDKRKAMLKILERAGCKVSKVESVAERDPELTAAAHGPGPRFPMPYETSLMAPYPGDVYDSFWKARDPYALFPARNASVTRESKPMFPIHRPSPVTHTNNKLDDPRNAAAVETLMKIQHAGITLEDLLDLSKAIKTWTPEHDAAQRAAGTGHVGTATDKSAALADPSPTSKAPPNADRDAAAESSQTSGESAVGNPPADSGESDAELPLKSDPKFEKYFRMLDKGLPDGAVRNALQRDGLDPSVLDLDPTRSYAAQTAATTQDLSGGELPLKSDPRFEKYFRMLDKGLPEGAVRNALVRDGVDTRILDLDPNQNYESQTATDTANIAAVVNNSPVLKDDPRFEKYFRMLDKGLPEGAVRNALLRDGADTRILDLNPNLSYSSQTGTTAVDSDAPVLKEDPRFEKYFRMLNKGLPEGAVRNALVRDGVDARILDLDPDKTYESQTGATTVESAAPVLTVKDCIEANQSDLDPATRLSPQTPRAGSMADDVPLKNDPIYEKYYRMLEKGLPIGAVRNALQRDGLDPSILALDRNRSVSSQASPPRATANRDTGIPLREDPDWKKYFTMLKMGLPLGAVKNAVVRDGKDPTFMDFDPNKSLEFQLQSNGIKLPTSAKKKKRVRRKKIYWTPIDPGQVKEDSLWSIVRGKVQMSRLKYDVQEFEDLFTESADPNDQNRKKAALGAKKVKKSVQVIDGKRSMNGGIILLRLKMDYNVIATMVDDMDVGQLDATQLQALKENLPTEEETKGLLAYMKGAGASEDEKRSAYVQLSECEKYMLTMIEVENAAEKFDCMLYRVQFKHRMAEISDAIRTVETACNEVRSSEKLREIMALILTLVNEINTGGDGKLAVGFSLEALLKLNEAKAFDRKTSVLQYLVRLITSNDSQLLDFRNDLIHVSPAENIILDSLIADIKSLEDELVGVLETAKAQADMFEAEGRVQPFSIQELKEQKTAVRNIDNVPQYNQIQHLTGRTSMERFAFNADRAIKEAIEYAGKVKESYARLLDYMCESEVMASNEFFGTMRRFATEFEKAREQVEKEEKAKKREKAKLASGKRTTNRNFPPPADPVSSSPASTDGGSIFTATASETGDAEVYGDANAAQLLGMQLRTGSSAGFASGDHKSRVPGSLNLNAARKPVVVEDEEVVVCTEAVGDESEAPSYESHSGVATPSTAGMAVEATEGALAPTSKKTDSASYMTPDDSPTAPLGSLLPSPDDAAAPRRGITSTMTSPADQLARPTPMSIAQMAAAAAASRAARRMEESPENVLGSTNQASEPPSSPRRSHQVSSSPPSSPSRIASLLATKLFGWHAANEPEDVVEEVDL